MTNSKSMNGTRIRRENKKAEEATTIPPPPPPKNTQTNKELTQYTWLNYDQMPQLLEKLVDFWVMHTQ